MGVNEGDLQVIGVDVILDNCTITIVLHIISRNINIRLLIVLQRHIKYLYDA